MKINELGNGLERCKAEYIETDLSQMNDDIEVLRKIKVVCGDRSVDTEALMPLVDRNNQRDIIAGTLACGLCIQCPNLRDGFHRI
jgi:hypothetical protein